MNAKKYFKEMAKSPAVKKAFLEWNKRILNVIIDEFKKNQLTESKNEKEYTQKKNGTDNEKQ
jgi:hypothetical protein